MLRRRSLQEPVLGLGPGLGRGQFLRIQFTLGASSVFASLTGLPACILLTYPLGIPHAVASDVWKAQTLLVKPFGAARHL